MNRRRFVQSLCSVPVGATCLTQFECVSRAKNEQFGIILSSLKSEVKENPDQVFNALAKAGYTYIESIGRYGIPAEHTMPSIVKYGLKPISTGDGMSSLLSNTSHYLQLAQTYDLPYIICYYPWLDSAENLTHQQCFEAADNLNRIAKIVNENGRKFAWHNHDKEFYSLKDHTSPFKIIMENTDQDLVNLELDIFWVKSAGYEPLKIMEEYKDRITILHLKDMRADERNKNTAPGKGIIDFKSILKEKEQTAIEYLIVEFAGEDLGVEEAIESIRYLKSLGA